MPGIPSSNLFVFTGGPGAGKSTLIEALGAHGLAAMPEAGRAIIRAQTAIGGHGRPDGDRLHYAELMLSWELRSHEQASLAGGLHLFDRGVPDTLGYLQLMGLPIPPHMRAAAERYRYNETVFLLPPWRAIYTTDTERSQSFAEAERTCDTLCDVYARLGYQLVEVPPAPVEERCRFVLAAMKQAPAG